MKIAHCIGPDFALWCGNDDITIPLLSIGGSGVISVWANVQPQECHDMVMDYLEGRREKALAAAVEHLELNGTAVLPEARCFRAVTVLEGEGTVNGTPVQKGQSFLVPHGIQALTVNGSFTAILSQPV